MGSEAHLARESIEFSVHRRASAREMIPKQEDHSWPAQSPETGVQDLLCLGDPRLTMQIIFQTCVKGAKTWDVVHAGCGGPTTSGTAGRRAAGVHPEHAGAVEATRTRNSAGALEGFGRIGS